MRHVPDGRLGNRSGHGVIHDLRRLFRKKNTFDCARYAVHKIVANMRCKTSSHQQRSLVTVLCSGLISAMLAQPPVPEPPPPPANPSQSPGTAPTRSQYDSPTAPLGGRQQYESAGSPLGGPPAAPGQPGQYQTLPLAPAQPGQYQQLQLTPAPRRLRRSMVFEPGGAPPIPKDPGDPRATRAKPPLERPKLPRRMGQQLGFKQVVTNQYDQLPKEMRKGVHAPVYSAPPPRRSQRVSNQYDQLPAEMRRDIYHAPAPPGSGLPPRPIMPGAGQQSSGSLGTLPAAPAVNPSRTSANPVVNPRPNPATNPTAAPKPLPKVPVKPAPAKPAPPKPLPKPPKRPPGK